MSQTLRYYRTSPQHRFKGDVESTGQSPANGAGAAEPPTGCSSNNLSRALKQSDARVSAIIALSIHTGPQPARAVCETASGSTAVHRPRATTAKHNSPIFKKQLEEVKKERDIYKRDCGEVKELFIFEGKE